MSHEAVLLSRDVHARAHVREAGATTTLCGKEIPARRRAYPYGGEAQVACGGYYAESTVCRSCRAKASGESTSTGARLTKAEALALHARAIQAARAAAEGASTTPMVVGEPVDLFASLTGKPDGGIDRSKPHWIVNEGVCGMAWATISPGNCSFARHLAKEGIGHKGYYGGWEVYRPGFNGQSYERGMAAADAYATVIREAGIKCYSGGRLD